MPTAPKSAQVAIAVFYDRTSRNVLHNALVIIHSESFIMRPQDKTRFYVLRSARGQWSIQPYSYKSARTNGLVFIGLVHIGSTDKQITLIENQLVGSLAAQPKFDPTSLSTWAINAAFEYVLSSPDSEKNKNSVGNAVCRYRNRFEDEANLMKRRCGGTFESAIPRLYTLCEDSLPCVRISGRLNPTLSHPLGSMAQ